MHIFGCKIFYEYYFEPNGRDEVCLIFVNNYNTMCTLYSYITSYYHKYLYYHLYFIYFTIIKQKT